MMNSDMLILSMLSGNGKGNGNSDSLLPILLMQQQQAKNNVSEESEGNGAALNNEVLNLMVYRPLGLRMVENYAARIRAMSAEQKAKLQAALSMNMLSSTQQGKFGETLMMAAHSCMTDLFGEPMAAISAVGATTVNSGNVGAETLGNAKKSVKDQAKEIAVDGDDTVTAAKKENSKANNKYRDVIVT